MVDVVGDGGYYYFILDYLRLVRLRHLGRGMFYVVDSVNSKLQTGDVFEMGCFILGHPLCIPRILRNGENTSPYIAGSRDGLTKIELCK